MALSVAKREDVLTTIGEFADLPPHKVLMDSCLFEDLGIDEIGRVQLVLELEMRFGVDIPEADIERMGTVTDVVMLVDHLRGGSR